MESDTRTVLERMLDAFVTGDTDEVHEFVADGYIDHQGQGDLRSDGPGGFMAVVRAARNGYATLNVEATDLVADDSRVAARLRWSGLALDGATVRRETIDLIRVVDGRAVEHWGARLSKTREPAPAN